MNNDATKVLKSNKLVVFMFESQFIKMYIGNFMEQ